MAASVLLRGARQLLTLRGPGTPRRGPAMQELGIIHDGALLIEDGVIVEVGVSRRVENLASARKAQEIDATGRVVMPGFVDCHTHLICGAPSLEGREQQFYHGEQWAFDGAAHAVRYESGQRLERRARLVVEGMVRHGTTCLEAKSGYGLDDSGELKILRALADLHRAPLDVVSTFLASQGAHAAGEWGSGRLERISSELLPKIKHRALAHYVDFDCDDRVVEKEAALQFLESARELGFRLKVHAFRSSRTAVPLAVSMGAVSVDQEHCASTDDVEMLGRSNTIAVMLPGSSFYQQGGGGPSARALIDGGAAVALASDFNPATSPTYNMQLIIALACARQCMTPAEAICAATINAAWAIGCEDWAGSLEVGKPADLILLNAPDYREIPYHFGVNLVRTTMKRGIVIYQQGKVDVTHRPVQRDL